MRKLHDATDLSKLSHVSAKDLQDFVAALNDIRLNDVGSRKVVVAIGTGGTIAMRITDDGQWVPDLNFDGVMDHASPLLKEHFLIKGFDAFSIDSSQMNYSHTRDLAICLSYIWQNIDIHIAGFLVLHGTDTMTYSSAAVSLMMGQGLPFSVCFTGAQKPIQEPINDAATNLRNALYTLEALYENNMAEVVVVMGDMAVLGTSSEKIDDSQANAFEAPLHKYVARFNRLDYPIKLAGWLKPKRSEIFAPRIWDGDYSHTLVVKSHLGLCPDTIARQVTDEQIKAVILYSYGGNTVYEPIFEAIMPIAKKKNMPVFVVSPVNAELRATYVSAHKMIEQGVVPLYMTLSAALAKIEIALCLHSKDMKALANFMQESYVGEVPSTESRYIAEKH